MKCFDPQSLLNDLNDLFLLAAGTLRRSRTPRISMATKEAHLVANHGLMVKAQKLKPMEPQNTALFTCAQCTLEA